MVGYSEHKILVTGGTGFIGSRLAERLAFEEHANVRVLVHNWRSATWVSRADIELVQGDIRDPTVVANAVKDCDIIFHCVGVGGSRNTCMSINVEGTRTLLQAAADAGIKRIVYLSSIAVHGPNPPDNANEEAAFCSVGNHYGDSKIEAEKLISQFVQKNPIPVVIIRPTFVWGPRSDSFTIWPIQCMKSGKWYLVDQGHGSCHALYIDNLVDALLLAGLKREAAGQVFLITDEQESTWSEFFSYYAKMLGMHDLPSISSQSHKQRSFRFLLKFINNQITKIDSSPNNQQQSIITRAIRIGLQQSHNIISNHSPFDAWDTEKFARIGRLDTTKARTLLGYQPRILRDVGMRETEIWLRDQRYL
jgi:nucleoside-diphosphate-sugar epimerase